MSRFRERSARPRALPALLAVLAVACGGPRADLGPRPVPDGAFAVVGQRTLRLDVLRRLADERDPREVGRSLIGDALLAQEFSSRHPERALVVERGVLVRGLLDSLRQQALSQSPLRAEELDLAAQTLWAQLDRPRCVRTVNVMVVVPPLGEGEHQERIMRQIAEAVRGAATPEELNLRARAVPSEGVEVTVVMEPPLTEDGRVYAQTPADAAAPVPPIEYARAAAQLTYIGETSELVATATGYHVLMAIDILPPLAVDEPERSRRLRGAIADRRIGSDLDELRRHLSGRVEVWQNPHRAPLTSLVWRTPPVQ